MHVFIIYLPYNKFVILYIYLVGKRELFGPGFHHAPQLQEQALAPRSIGQENNPTVVLFRVAYSGPERSDDTHFLLVGETLVQILL